MTITESKKPDSVPSFDPELKLPYKKGECPEAGWYAIEPAGEYTLAYDPRLLAQGEKRPEGDLSIHKELMDDTCLRQLVEAYDPDECGGNGIPINENHLYLEKSQTDKSKGYIRALATDGKQLYGYLSLTTQGHAEINEGEFWAVSTEYYYNQYELRGKKSGATYWSPSSLRGLAFTNHPNRAKQAGVMRMNNIFHNPQSDTMNTPKETTDNIEKNSQPPSEDEIKQNEQPEDKDALATNDDDADDELKLKLNSSTGDALGDFLNELAAIFGYDDDMDGEAMLEALRVHKADFDALAQASSGKATNSAPRSRFPRMPMFANPQSVRINTGSRPAVNTTTDLRVGGESMRVNSRELALAAHCERAVDAEARRLGRNLTAQEFRAINAEAESTFKQ